MAMMAEDAVTTSSSPPLSLPSTHSTSADSQSRSYIVRYEGNSSKKWDGREIVMDGNWLEQLYKPPELIAG